MDKNNTNYIATQEEAKTIGKSSSAVVSKRLSTKEIALSLGCQVSGKYDDNQCVKYVDLSPQQTSYNIHITQPTVGRITYVSGEYEVGKTYTVRWEGNTSYEISSWEVVNYINKQIKVEYTSSGNSISFVMPNFDVAISVSLRLPDDRHKNLIENQNIVVLSVANTPAERVLSTGGVDENNDTHTFFSCSSGTDPETFSGLLENIITEMPSGDVDSGSYDYNMFTNPFVVDSEHPLGYPNDLALTCCSTKIDIWFKIRTYYNGYRIKNLTIGGISWASEYEHEYTLCSIDLYNNEIPVTNICGSDKLTTPAGGVFYTITYDTQLNYDSDAAWLIHFIYNPDIIYRNVDGGEKVYFSDMRENLIRTLRIATGIGGQYDNPPSEFTIDFDYDEVNWRTGQNRQYATDDDSAGIYPGMRLKGGIQNVWLLSNSSEGNALFICHSLKHPLEIYSENDTNVFKIPGTNMNEINYDRFINGCTPYDIAGNIYYFHSPYMTFDSTNTTEIVCDDIGLIDNRFDGETHYGFKISFLHPSDEMDLGLVKFILGGIDNAILDGDYFNAQFQPNSNIDDPDRHNFSHILFGTSEQCYDTNVFYNGLLTDCDIDETSRELFTNYGLLSVSINDLKTIADHLQSIRYESEHKGTMTESVKITCNIFDVIEENSMITITIDWTELVRTGCFGSLLQSVYDIEIAGSSAEHITYGDSGFIWMSLEYGQHAYGFVMNPFSGKIINTSGTPLKWWHTLRTPDTYMRSDFNDIDNQDNSTALLDVREYYSGTEGDIGNRYGLVNHSFK